MTRMTQFCCTSLGSSSVIYKEVFRLSCQRKSHTESRKAIVSFTVTSNKERSVWVTVSKLRIFTENLFAGFGVKPLASHHSCKLSVAKINPTLIALACMAKS